MNRRTLAPLLAASLAGCATLTWKEADADVELGYKVAQTALLLLAIVVPGFAVAEPIVAAALVALDDAWKAYEAYKEPDAKDKLRAAIGDAYHVIAERNGRAKALYVKAKAMQP